MGVEKFSPQEQRNLMQELNLETIGGVMPGGLLVTGFHPELQILYASLPLAELLGYRTAQELCGTVNDSAAALVHPDDLERVLKELPNAASSGSTMDCRLLRRDGTSLWVRQRSRQLQLDSGQQVILTGYEDLSRVKTLEEEQNAVIRAIQGGVALYEISGEVCRAVYFSDGVPALTGHTRGQYESILREKKFPLFHQGDVERVQADLRKIAVDHQDMDDLFRKKHKNGSLVWVKAHAHYMGERDGCPLILVIFHNISTESAVYEDVLNSYCAGVVILDPGTREILYANKAACRIAYAACPDYSGKPCYSFMWGLSYPCADCVMKKITEGASCKKLRYVPEQDRWFLSELRNMTWFGRNVVTAFLVDVTDQERNRLAMLQNERLLRQAIEDANLLSFEYDLKSSQLVSENQVLQRAGYLQNPRNLPETQIADGYVCEESIADCRELYAQVRQGIPTVCQNIWMYRRKDRTDRHCLRISYTVFPDTAGQPSMAFGLALDITEEENQRLMYYRRLSLLMRNSPETLCGYVINLKHGQVTEQMQPYCRGEELDGEIPLEQFLRDLRSQFIVSSEHKRYCYLFSREHLLRQYQNGESTVKFLHRGVFPDQSERFLITTATILQNPNSKELEAVVVTTDLTEKTIYRLIAQQLVNERYDIVALIDPARDLVKFCFANNEYTGSPEVKIEHYEKNRQNVAKKLLNKDEAHKYLECTSLPVITSQLDSEGAYSFSNCRLIHGKKRVKNYHYAYLDNTHREILCTVEDATVFSEREEQQLHTIENALRQAERANAAKSEFLSRMSHDIRTPMNVILNMTRFARDDYKGIGNGDVQEDLDRVENTSNYLLGLINDILDVSRIESGKMELHPTVYSYDELASYIYCMVKPLCAQKNITFVWNRSKTSRPVFIDKIRFNQMLFNLLSNAVKYTPEGGTVTLLENKDVVTEQSCTCSFSVIDNGVGMSEEFQKQMFDPFAREETASETQGTGLGLAIVRKIVDLMGGTLTVKSKKGEGSAFTVRVTLPFATPQQIADAQKQEKTGAEDGRELRGKRILVAEDHDLNMKIIVRLLESRGMTVQQACNGQEVMDLFAASAPGTFDAILMDVRMPVHDGLYAARQIRALERSDAAGIPIIAMTANAFEEDRKQSRNAGMTGFLTKPIQPALLFETLTKSLSE